MERNEFMSKKKKERRKKRSVAGATAKRRETAEQGFSDMFALPQGIGMFSLKSTGTKRIDVIPYTVGKGNPNAEEGAFYWERTFFAHRNVGVNDEMVICPARTIKERCPICEYRAKLSKDPDADEENVKALAPSKRMLVNVVEPKKDANKLKVWHISHWYFGKAVDIALAAAYEDHEDNMDNFCDPEGGHYLKCVAEQGYEQRGYEVVRVDFIPRKHDLSDDILDQAVCLDEILVVKSYADLKEMFFATTDDDEDDEEPKAKKKSKKKAKKKKEEEEEDDDNGEDDDDDDDDNGEDDDDDDDDDNDDDDDDNGEDDDDDDDDDDNGDDDDDNDWQDDDDDDDDEPKKKKKSKKAKKKGKNKKRK
jgi:hypothetical protein